MKTNYEHIKKFVIDLKQQLKNKNAQLYVDDFLLENPIIVVNKSIISLKGQVKTDIHYIILWLKVPTFSVKELKSKIIVRIINK